MFGRRHLFDFIALPVGLLALGLLIWWAVYAGPDRADKIEAALKTEVEAILAEDEFDWLKVNVEGRNVTLTGVAPSEELHETVVARLRRVSGTGGFFWGWIRKLDDQLIQAPPPDIYEIKGFFDGKSIRLEGNLSGIYGRDRLLAFLANQGVAPENISLNMLYADGMPAGDWYGTVELGLEQLLKLQQGSMDLVDTRLVLIGETPDDATREAIITRLTTPPSGYTVDVDLSGSVVWTASVSNGELILFGDVPEAPDLNQLNELANRFFDGPVTNNQKIRQMSERAWVTGVRQAMPNFVKFTEGEMTYRGNRLIIKGKAPQSVIDHLKEDVVRVGALVNFQFDVEPGMTQLKSFQGLKAGEKPTPAVCESALHEALSENKIDFSYRRSSLKRESGETLDKIETVLKTCEDQVFEIAAYTNVNNRYVSGQELTEARQRAVSDYFIARGVPLNQVVLSEVTAGVSAPISGDESRDNSQIRMRLKE